MNKMASVVVKTVADRLYSLIQLSPYTPSKGRERIMTRQKQVNNGRKTILTDIELCEES